ncbi:K+-transporting ATPase ATPase C chain [Actinoalloteichus cyanogriseus DSM 43889]|uniref:Potassium-transporting ATPase KdpC subunit n=1 Tax=Actinoalloteichus caeruleus DSM 43889 TaxID=1120930 RepID=A0ABT1JHM9_ACTCY|nr:K+-transporting ATPase ATPase C chain [Actinoalloteichus caeruleus DSM 43889]
MNTVPAWLPRPAVAALRLLLVLTALTGLCYPAAVWAVSRLPPLRAAAEGSPTVTDDGTVVGSALLGVDPVDPLAAEPTADRYFHTRPAGNAATPLGPGGPDGSGATPYSITAPELVSLVEERRRLVADREGVPVEEVPADAVTASASGLDPHVSPEYATLQVPRVARTNGLPEARVHELVAQHTRGRRLGFLGEPTVNVPLLNLAVQLAADQGGRRGGHDEVGGR